MKDFTFLQKKYVIPTYVNRGITFVDGKGAYLVDGEGNTYLDCMSNYGVSIFGYNHPRIVETLSKQLTTLVNLHGSFANDTRALASEQLIKRCGEPTAQVYWSNSGTEAIEAALKFAVLKTGKHKFISSNNGYHGKTLGALSAIGVPKYRTPFEPLLWNFMFHEFGNSKNLATQIDQDVAAVIIEPVQGEGGIYLPPKNYLAQVKALCEKHHILLILDEIQTGIGRTGTFLASEQSGIRADIYCLGKGLAGGMPVGATIVTAEIAQAIPRGIHTSTFGGSPLTCAGVLATLELLTPTQLNTIEKLGKTLLTQLQAIASKHIVTVRGIGLMIGIQVTGNRDSYIKRLQAEHILVIPAGEDVIRLLPPYIITEKEIVEIVQKITTVMQEG